MESDFSGWVTKAGLECTDGKTIMPNAFQHQDMVKVPLVWQHGHSDPENVLGHVILHNRGNEGVYGYAFLNKSKKAIHAGQALEHKDLTQMSIWANKLQMVGNQVLHGFIREVSLVLSGANPGAVIENVTLRHSADGSDDEVLPDEAIITTGLGIILKHEDQSANTIEVETPPVEGETPPADGSTPPADGETPPADGTTPPADGSTPPEGESQEDPNHDQEVFDSLTPEQQDLFHSFITTALLSKEDPFVFHADDPTVEEVWNTMTPEQQKVCHYITTQALVDAGVAHGNLDPNNQEGNKVNVFTEGANGANGDAGKEKTLSHDAMKEIISDATTGGSLKKSLEAYAIAHGIEGIDTLFPDAVATDATPEFDGRDMSWVPVFMNAVKKSPFSRIKTLRADISEDEARAKGYIKGNLKKEEFFEITKRSTDPQTVYKKQALDRDDVVDITDFDVVAWVKGEMRLLLNEEIARAALVGDGRGNEHPDKIKEVHIRPIATDHELFNTTVNVNLADANSDIEELTDAVIRNRKNWKGTGVPIFFTTEDVIAEYLLKKDELGRRIYKDLSEVASVLRCSQVVSCEVMEEDATLIGVMVNPVDYRMGATKGGEVTLFEDFDIDYNKEKFLLETRLSGALTKLKAALTFRRATGTLVTPNEPDFDADTGVLTINATTHVVYKNADTGDVLSGTVNVDTGETINVEAVADSGYYFANSTVDDWSFTAN